MHVESKKYYIIETINFKVVESKSSLERYVCPTPYIATLLGPSKIEITFFYLKKKKKIRSMGIPYKL